MVLINDDQDITLLMQEIYPQGYPTAVALARIQLKSVVTLLYLPFACKFSLQAFSTNHQDRQHRAPLCRHTGLR